MTDTLTAVAVETTGVDSQKQRVESLKERKRLRSDKQRLEQRRDEHLGEKKRGYRRKHREIYERHAIAVTTKPIATTLVVYERGELALELRNGSSFGSMRVPYAIGAGVVDDVRCDRCNRLLSRDNPVRSTSDGLGCRSCQ